MGTSLQFTIDSKAIGAVIDRDKKLPIGTAFAFVRPHWFVTAKHVIFRNDGTRRDVDLQSIQETITQPAELLYAHPTVDLAVLRISQSACRVPLFPAHHGFAGQNGLIVAGYAPSRALGNARSVLVNRIESFQMETRERTTGNEEVVIFQVGLTESGSSGGPVLGSGGGVVGVVIEAWESGGRATVVEPLLRQLAFSD